MIAKEERAREAEHKKQINELYAEIGRLSARLSWLIPALAGGARKNLASSSSKAERLKMLEKGANTLTKPPLENKMQAVLSLA